MDKIWTRLSLLFWLQHTPAEEIVLSCTEATEIVPFPLPEPTAADSSSPPRKRTKVDDGVNPPPVAQDRTAKPSKTLVSYQVNVHCGAAFKDCKRTPSNPATLWDQSKCPD